MDRLLMLYADYTYSPEGYDELLREVERAMGLAPDCRRVYAVWERLFRRIADQATEHAGAILCGTFAKTDYLLKEHGADRRLVSDVNALRVRLRKSGTLGDDMLRGHMRHDMETFKRLVECLSGTAPTTSCMEKEEEEGRGSAGEAGCLRFILSRWDDEYMYGAVDGEAGGGPVRVAYAHGSRAYDYDWTYLRRLFHEGAQMNLVRPRSVGGVIMADLIIFEPDYLVDISAVARCFTNYAESPLPALLGRLQPQQCSEAIMLGNFAGQMLDEAMTGRGGDYACSAREFFRQNAVKLLTAGVGPDFHYEARRQRENIARAIGQDMPRTVSRFDVREGMVEPSFFSEMLGLQGRMDYLQLDLRVLMEQKSGKGEFPYGGFSVPRHREEHYVQLLLYMLLIRYNYSETYERNNRELHAFLLYSKYASPLLGLGFAPELVFRAIKVRNRIAAAELMYARPGMYERVLGTLTPERVNEKGVRNPLWTRWQQGQIAALLEPIHGATALERAYYFRFLTFISNEHVLSKLGNRTKECSGFASTWHETLEEKRLAGNIYDGLTLEEPGEGHEGSVERVTLRFGSDEAGDMANFRTGDVVILYPYARGTEPDARRTMVFRCGIESMDADSITLLLRARQSDARVFLWYGGMAWAIEHDFIEASYTALYRGMHAFLSAPRSRRDLLMLQREPEVDATRRLKGDYGDFNDMALRVKQARDLFLIIGPPGTGKTSFGMLDTVREELLEPEASVLLLSYTNRAVDEMCGKLQEDGIDFIRVGSTLNCAPQYRSHLLEEKALECATLAELQRMIEAARVVVGTTTALSAHIALLQIRPFTLAVIDEASQILEPHLMGLLSAHEGDVPSIGKIVMIGDHKQLPAVVQQTQEVSEVKEPQLRDILLTDCRLSLFERLLRRYHANEAVTYMLCRQGRMHRDIARFPNEAFYGGRLTEVPLRHQTAMLEGGMEDAGRQDRIGRAIGGCRLAFVATDSPGDGPSDKVNMVEAKMIAEAVHRIYIKEGGCFSETETVGVIVPYRNQIAAIRSLLDGYGVPALRNISIDTVERFQGSQRRYILYGFTISKRYQLKFLTDNVFIDVDGAVVDRKLNVAMTRAKEHLIIFGNPELLARNYTFARLMDFARGNGCFF